MNRAYYIFLFLVIKFNFGICQNQNGTVKIDTNNIYYQAAKTFIDSTFNNTSIDSSEVIFQSNSELINNLPSRIGKTKVFYLSKDELKKQYDFKKDSIRIYELTPIFINENVIYVGIKCYDYWYTLEDNAILHSYSIIGNMISISFNYDCSRNKFRPYKIKK